MDASSPPPSVSSTGPLSKRGLAWTWRPRVGFGPRLRAQREPLGLALRDAAPVLGVSFTQRQKVETNGRARAPSLWLLTRTATLYGNDLELVLARAGYKMEVPGDLRNALQRDDAFATLVQHPALRPACMDERWLEAFSRVQKAQWLDFTRRFEAHPKAGGGKSHRVRRGVWGLLRGRGPRLLRLRGSPLAAALWVRPAGYMLCSLMQSRDSMNKANSLQSIPVRLSGCR